MAAGDFIEIEAGLLPKRDETPDRELARTALSDMCLLEAHEMHRSMWRNVNEFEDGGEISHELAGLARRFISETMDPLLTSDLDPKALAFMSVVSRMMNQDDES